MKLNIKDILIIELELSNICNLKCPLCLSVLDQTKHIFKNKHNRDINDLLKQLDKFTSLELVVLAGDASEPTLYPHLFELIDYLHNRNVTVYMYTNANTHDTEYWKQLGKKFIKDDNIFFTVCGSTQEIHEKYRVGSNLQQILDNVTAFKTTNTDKNDSCLFLKFKYNAHDINNVIKKYSNMFSDFFIQITDPRIEWLNIENNNYLDNFSLPDKQQQINYKLKNYYMKNKKDIKIICNSLITRRIRIDNNGNIQPCICYNLYANKQFEKDGILDYSDILNFKIKECHNCNKEMLEYFKLNDFDDFYICTT